MTEHHTSWALICVYRPPVPAVRWLIFFLVPLVLLCSNNSFLSPASSLFPSFLGHLISIQTCCYCSFIRTILYWSHFPSDPPCVPASLSSEILQCCLHLSPYLIPLTQLTLTPSLIYSGFCPNNATKTAPDRVTDELHVVQPNGHFATSSYKMKGLWHIQSLPPPWDIISLWFSWSLSFFIACHFSPLLPFLLLSPTSWC